MIKNLFLWILVFTATTGYSQQPVMSVDSIPAYVTVKSLVPDCDRPAVAFSYFKNGEWNFREQAGFGYALFMNASGDAVNVSEELASAGVEDATTNPLIKGMFGYIAGLSQDKDGNWCVSVNEELKSFDGYFWFRVNSQWSMYIRAGCLNPVLVYDPVKEMTPKGLEECPTWEVVFLQPKKVECCTTIVQCPPPPPCDNCCPADSIVYAVEAYAAFEAERIGGELDKSIGIGVEWVQNYLHRSNKDQPWIEQPVGFYGGLVAYLAKKGIEFKPTCDTCGYWGDIPGGLVFHSDVYFGIQHRVFKRYGVFGFAELRYAWINTQHSRNKFLSDEGIKFRAGLRVKLETSPKFPIFRSLQFELGPQASTYARPDKKLAISGGGFLELRANFGAREKEVRDAEHAKRMKRAQAQFVRDSVARQERLVRDSVARVERDSVLLSKNTIERDSFLSNNPQPILIDTVALALDTTIHAPVLPWVKAPLPPMPFTKTAKGVKLNKAKTKVLHLQTQHNELRTEAQNDVSKWPALQKNNRHLKKAEKDLQRKQERFDKA